MNPFDALATFILGTMKQGLYARWLKFLFELGFSGIASFLLSCGSALMAKAAPAWAIGFGMLWAGMSMVYLFRRERSRLTAGMIVALPGDEAQKELDANFQVIEKPDKEK